MNFRNLKLFVCLLAGIVVSYSFLASAFSACTNMKPNLSACKLELNACTNVNNQGGCTDRTGQTTTDGPFDCASGDGTDCVNGVANQSIYCYITCNCIASGEFCVMGNLCQSTAKVPKVSKPCPKS
jgi:hypothetical protein